MIIVIVRVELADTPMYLLTAGRIRNDPQNADILSGSSTEANVEPPIIGFEKLPLRIPLRFRVVEPEATSGGGQH
ncbi:hypothetical protein SE91_32120 [Bradyrhizobium sp. DOA1]|nr:hypothetical protein SE91_32120 [Bradyrhizobium sp. DOA1]